jgi:hypothetical protein
MRYLTSDMSLEDLRKTYRPPDVRVLFVGESAPAGGTFFYQEDSTLWRYTRAAFSDVYGFDCRGNDSFCEFFKSKGCYLEDLCTDPVNHMKPRERRQACIDAIPCLTNRLSSMSPRVVVCVKASIMRHVRSAMDEAGLQALPLHGLPHPACGHQREYATGLASLLRQFQADGVIV